MDKPTSMPLKEYLLRIMSVRTNIPQKTIEAVVEHQFESIVQVMQKPNIHSIEISGFGKFLFNKKKAQKLWDKNLERKASYEEELKNPDLSETKKKSLTTKLENTLLWFDKSKEKIDAVRPSMGGMEEQVTSCPGDETNDRGDIQKEDGSMQGMPTIF